MAEEKDKFFHALSVHSRMRPDLIAEEIGTKTLADVLGYLDMLEDSVRNPGNVASSSGLKFVPLLRKDFPIAHEISEEWLEFEDEQAASVTVLEPILRSQGVERAKAGEITEKRNTIRAKRGAGRTAGNQRDREGEKTRKAQLKDWIEQRQIEWDLQEILECLTDPILRTIDAILREDEEGWAVPTESTLGSEPTRSEATMASAEPEAFIPEALQSLYVDDETIDPSLRGPHSLLAAEDPHEDDIGPASTSTTSTVPRPGNHVSFNPVTPPFMPTSVLPEPSLLDMPPLDAAALAQLPGPDVSLSPASRRRLQKRLYMRRKRAEKNGETADNTITRLKPGRKSKPRKADLPTIDLRAEDGSEAEKGDQHEQATRHPHPSGKTLPYKIREQFDSQGIDAVRLRQEGLGLFHMVNLSRLMRYALHSLHRVL